MRFWVLQQQTLTVEEEFGSTTIGQESEGANADKAAGQNMEKETSQELLRAERHFSLLITMRVILPAEGNLVPLESHKTVVGDGDPMGVAGKITQHMMGSAEGWLPPVGPLASEPFFTQKSTHFLRRIGCSMVR